LHEGALLALFAFVVEAELFCFVAFPLFPDAFELLRKELEKLDPSVKFILFLEKFCGVDKNKLRFSIQIFSDISKEKSIDYWMKELSK
jgi:hypothetical protein